MKITHEAELAELRVEFAKVDCSDPASVLEWFAKFSHLTLAQHAMVARRTIQWVRLLRRKAFLWSKMPKTMPKTPPRRANHNIIVPENWNTKEWLQATVVQYGIKPTSKALGIHFSKLYELLELHEIDRPGKRKLTNNPCCTKEWCYEHYVTQHLTLKECGKLAGIGRHGFTAWLVKFNIPIRQRRGAIAKPWVSELIAKLDKQEIVLATELHHKRLRVRYRNFYIEQYYLDDKPWTHRRYRRSFLITRDDARLERIPRVTYQYESGLSNPNAYAAHIQIPSAEFYRASLIEQRLAVHEFARQICRRGWVWPTYPEHIMDEELAAVRESRLNQYYRNDRYWAYPKRNHRTLGLLTMTSFFGLEELIPIFKSPRRVVEILQKIILDGNTINFDTMVRYAIGWGYSRAIKIFDVGVYYWLFRQLGVKGTVLDLYPGHGQKAIACTLAGLRYTTIPTPTFETALQRGFDKYLGLEYTPYTGQRVDWVISDNDFGETDITKALQYGNAGHLLHFVPRADYTRQLVHKPSQVIQIVTKHHNQVPNFLFLF